MKMWVKVTLSVVGLAMVSVSTTYTAHMDAKVMGYIAAICASVGSYLLGLFQSRPGNHE